jgi:Na+-transporting methylmalonyl-CoA/oxaloacetate decarboxylase gamma subunit
MAADTPARSPARASNRGFWIVTIPMVVVSAVLLVLVFANRPVAEKASEFTARHSLRSSLDAARAIARDRGSLAAATTLALRERLPDLAFTDPDLSSNNAEVVSVYATAALWAGAARAEDGACFWIRVDAAGRVATGRGSDCSADAASTAAPVAWPSP